MNQEIKAKWLEALRSGKYKQGQRYLRTKVSGEDRFCCLGVLCDIVAPLQWDGNEVNITHNGSSGYPVSSIREQVGLEQLHCDALARMNDHGKSFAEIAKAIEQEL